MKKFLSILLALAVGFTFTFGSAMSAFAAETTVADEQKAMADYVNAYAGSIVYNQDGYVYNPADYDAVPKAAVEATVAKVIEDYNKEIETAKILEKDIHNAWATPLTDMENVVFVKYASTLYDNAITAKKTEAEAAIAAVDLNAYLKADADKINKKIAALKNSLAKTGKTKAVLNDIVAKLNDLNTTVKGTSTIASQETALAETKAAAVKAIEDAAAEFKAARKDKLSKTTGTAAEIAANNAKLATLDTDVQNVTAYYTDQINAVVIDGKATPVVDLKAATATVNTVKAEALDTFKKDLTGETAFENLTVQLTSKDLLVDYANKYAESMKSVYDVTTGLLKYNAATVDKKLVEVLGKINALDADYNTYAKIEKAFADVKTAVEEKAALKGLIEKNIETVKNYAKAWENCDNEKAVKAIADEYVAKIEAATTADEIEALVKEAKKAMDAYLTAAQVETLKAAVMNQMVSLKYIDGNSTVGNEAGGIFANYAEGVAAKNPENVYSSATKAQAVKQAAEVLYEAAIAKQDATLYKDAAAIKALLKDNYNNALAKIDAMKSNAALTAEKQAVEAAIAALPTTVTLAEKDKYTAVKEQYDAYKKNAGATEINATSKALLNKYMSNLQKLEKENVENLIKALPATITVNDAAAVKAAKDAKEAYDKAYPNAAIAKEVATKLALAEKALSDAKVLDAAKKIAALPAAAEITADDAAAVKAAREAYDALTDAEKGQLNANFIKTLEGVEAAIAALTKVTDDDVKAYLNTLKVTVKSAKTAKKNVKVTAKVTVKATGEAADFTKFTDAGYTFKYKFYRSTKTTVKYTVKKAKDTTTWTNTAGKKGTKYYYKVKVFAYDKDGKFVGQTYQSQCNYTSKVFGK